MFLAQLVIYSSLSLLDTHKHLVMGKSPQTSKLAGENKKGSNRASNRGWKIPTKVRQN